MKNYQHFYDCITAPFRQSKVAIKTIQLSNQVIVMIMYVGYILMLIAAGMRSLYELGKIILIPAGGFIFLSILRQLLNAPRPYERYDISPLISRKKTGDSFPSRHMYSATVIAMCGLLLNSYLGMFLLFLAIALGVLRVIGGVHFPRDVIAGFIWGMVCGMLLFII